MSGNAPSPTVHLFTVDLEEYFQVGAFEHKVDRNAWHAYPSRLEYTVELLLDLLARHGARATFFTLGWIADRHPGTVRRIAAAGHEVASHGYWHQRVDSLTPAQFRDDVRAAKTVIEDACGAPVHGYRAPNFSIRPGCEWAFDVLIQEGYRYDSSLFPIRRPGYGYPHAPPLPHLVHRPVGTICELPLATTMWRGVRVPAAGGAYLRHLPFALVRRCLEEHDADGIPAVFYIHPWELDPQQPRLRVSLPARLRHYAGLRRTQPRLERLLEEFHFTSVADCLHLAPAAASPRPARATTGAD